jgi:rhamnosyltransferase
VKRNKCSFILPTINIEKNIGPLLESIYSQTYDGEIEVLILDSSNDHTVQIARNFPVKLTRVEPAEYNNAKTRNLGASMTDGESLVFLSADVEIYDKHWLSKLTSHFSDPKVAGVFGRQVPRQDAYPMERFYRHFCYPPETAILSLRSERIFPRIPIYFSNVNSAIRRSAWEEIKLPEILVSEDLEWARRALISGYKIVYDSQAAVFHSHKRSLKGCFQWHFTVGAAMPLTHSNPEVDFYFADFILAGLKYVWQEYKFMLKNGYAAWIPNAIVYDMSGFLGTFLGTLQRYMPLSLKRVLGERSKNWMKYANSMKG